MLDCIQLKIKQGEIKPYDEEKAAI